MPLSSMKPEDNYSPDEVRNLLAEDRDRQAKRDAARASLPGLAGFSMRIGESLFEKDKEKEPAKAKVDYSPDEIRGLLAEDAGSMKRPDSTLKGPGFFGTLKRPDGRVSTEISIGVNFDGKETQIPSLVPTLSNKEVDYLISGGEVTTAIKDKAIAFAKQRMAQGKSPFAQPGEEKEPAETPEPGYGEVVGKGLVRGAMGLAGGVGALTRWGGEVAGIEPVARVGKEASEYWRKAAQEGTFAADKGLTRGTFMETPSFKRAVGIISEALPSLGLALFTGGAGMAAGLSRVAASWLAGTSLAALEGSADYEAAREAGKSISEASISGAASTAGTAILESLAIGRFLRMGTKAGKIAGRLPSVKAAGKGMAIEGMQEGSQQIWQNLVAKMGYEPTRELAQGLVESMIGGAGAGGIAGGVMSKLEIVSKKAKEAGVTDEDIGPAIDDLKREINEKAHTEILAGIQTSIASGEINSIAQIEVLKDQFTDPGMKDAINGLSSELVRVQAEIKVKEEQDAEEIRRSAEEISREEGIEREEEIGLRVRDAEKDRVEVAKRKEKEPVEPPRIAKPEKAVPTIPEEKKPAPEVKPVAVEVKEEVKKAKVAKEPWEMGKEEFAKSVKTTETLRPSERVKVLYAEDIELKPEAAKIIDKVANMDAVTGEIYAYKMGEDGIYNHADIFAKHKMKDATTITGFIDKDGDFVYQYPEEAHKLLTQQALKEGKPVPESVLADYPDLKPDVVPEAVKEPTAPEVKKPAEVEKVLAEEKQAAQNRERANKAKSFRMWVKWSGGIHPQDKTWKGEIRDIFGKEGKGRKAPPGMINSKTSLGVDILTLKAIEDGWLPKGATEDDFIRLLETDSNRKITDEALDELLQKEIDFYKAQELEAGRSEDDIRKAEEAGIQEANEEVKERKAGRGPVGPEGFDWETGKETKAFELIPEEPAPSKPTEEEPRSAIDLLKDEKGFLSLDALQKSPAYDGVLITAKDVINQGHTTLEQFTTRMKEVFAETWDKIKVVIKDLYATAQKILTSEVGAITIEGKPTQDLDQWAKDYLEEFIGAQPEATRPDVEKKVRKEEKAFDKQHLKDATDTWDVVRQFLAVRKQGLKKTKEDVKSWERLLSVPAHFFHKIESLGRVFMDGLRSVDNRHIILDEITMDLDGHYFTAELDTFRKQDKTGYRKYQKYLKHRDQNGIGYSIVKNTETAGWDLFGVKNKKTPIATFTEGVVGAEQQAVEAMIRAEANDYRKTGASEQAVNALIAGRRITNNGFDILFQAMRDLEVHYKETGQELPTETVNVDGKAVTVNLKFALARMGSIRGYYMPRIRKPGRFVVFAKKKGAHPIREHFEFKTLADGWAARKRTQGYTTTVESQKKMPEDVFQMAGQVVAQEAIINEALQRTRSTEQDAITVDTQTRALFAKALVEQVSNIIKGRGVRVHMIQRVDARGLQVWEGYEEDPGIALAKYARSVSAGEAKKIMARDMLAHFTGTDVSWKQFKELEGEYVPYEAYLDFVEDRRVDPINQPNGFKEGKSYMEHMLRNDEAIDRLTGTIKGIAVLKYLGGRVSAPLVNLTALVTSVPASMHGFGNIPLHKTFGYLAKAGKLYGTYRFGNKESLPADIQLLFDEIHNKGWHNAQYNREALAVLRGKAGRGWDTAIDWSMKAFGATEQLNRVSTIAGAYLGLKAQGQTDHDAMLTLAKKISDQSHATYGKANWPSIARGKHPAAQVMKAFYVFRTFSHNYMLTMKDLWGEGWTPKHAKAFSYMALSPAILAGAGGVVGFDLIMKAFAMAFDLDDPEEDMYNWLDANIGEYAEIFGRFGGFGLIGMNLKGSLEIGVTDLPTTWKDILGAPGSVIMDVYYGGENLLKGDVSKGLEKLAPLALAAPLKAYREATEGLTTRRNVPIFYGRDRVKADMTDAILRGLSFNPAAIAKIREQKWAERKQERRWKERRSDINSKIMKFMLRPIEDRSKADWADILEDIRQYNIRIKRMKLVGIIPYITDKSIRAHIRRSFKPTKREIRRRALTE